MNEKKNWELKGVFYECCRVDDGHCALWFGRDLPRACANMATYQITEGHIQNVDMKGVVVIQHQTGIGRSPIWQKGPKKVPHGTKDLYPRL